MPRRSGFVQAELSTAMTKTEPVFPLCRGGSPVFPFRERCISVGHTGAHPVYRHGRPLFVGGAGNRKSWSWLQVHTSDFENT
ncbi:MAG: hypothetical protein ACLU9S_23940 [Oscillospiraceae bacterium]